MKNISTIQKLLTLPLLFLVGSCGNFLDENPDNRVDLNTVEKASQLLTNAYSNGAYTFTEWMSDNVNYTTGTYRSVEHDQAYRWEEVTNDNQDTPVYFWNATYDAIAHANEVLAALDELDGPDDEKDAVKAEALLTRAYGHFMLVNLFAKHYDPETASSDPGIPYVLEPETEFLKKYDRNTVAEVYELIEDDLELGISLVDESFYANSGKYHFTRNAALAFASRYYLYKGDFDKCIEYSDQMLGTTPQVFVKDIETLLAQTADAEDFLREYTSPNDRSNLLLVRQITNYPVNVGYWPSQDLLEEIYESNNPWGEDDIRSPFTSNPFPAFVRGTGIGIAKFEFLFERSSLTSNVGLYYTIAPVFRGEEVLLNRAESYIYANQTELARKDLQVLANLRYDGAPTVAIATLRAHYGVNNDQLALLSYTIDERRKEFMHEGLRWFDLKRYGVPVTHDDEIGATMTLEGDDLRKVLQIPQAAIDVGGLEPNPR
jgi:starch-binding outer membrane protein, SusD/RagB family